MPLDTDIAYLAGLIDGEGCIRVKRSKPYRHLTGRQNASYHCSIHVRMVDEPAIAFLRDTLGGWYWLEKRRERSDAQRPLYCWQATDKDAEHILRALLPFLRVKRGAAENALALRDLQASRRQHRTKILGYRDFPNAYGTVRRVANKGYSDDYIAACDALYANSRQLNRVGPR